MILVCGIGYGKEKPAEGQEMARTRALLAIEGIAANSVRLPEVAGSAEEVGYGHGVDIQAEGEGAPKSVGPAREAEERALGLPNNGVEQVACGPRSVPVQGEGVSGWIAPLFENEAFVQKAADCLLRETRGGADSRFKTGVQRK
jgi:hypothetical protein